MPPPTDIRATARKWIDANIPAKAWIYSDGSTASQFTRLTGLAQARLVAYWRAHAGLYPHGGRPVLTSCNSFVGVYSMALGLPNLGAFRLHELLIKLKKQDAWVKSTADTRPKYGDIVRHEAFHMDVSLDSEGDTWHSVDGGMGGPHYDPHTGAYLGGHDIVRRVEHSPYHWKKILGWVDLELFVGSSEPADVQHGPSHTGALGGLWLNQGDRAVHPNAPAGAGGAGTFRLPGVLHSYPFDHHLPHPWAPWVRSLDPLEY